jgi:hypothetical protein
VWIIISWEYFSPQASAKSVMKCFISNAVDGTDVDILWNGGEECGNGKSECEVDGGTDCEGVQ